MPVACCLILAACHSCFSYPPFWTLYPQHVVDNSVGTVRKRPILVQRGHRWCSSGLVFEVVLDRLAGSRTAQVPRAPVWSPRVPAIYEFLLYGVVFPQPGVAYLGEGLDEHGYGVGAHGGQVVDIEALSFFHAAYVGAGYE